MSVRETVVRHEFVCVGTCEDPPVWYVEGRYNAAGEFEPTEVESMDCPEGCGERGEPTDDDVRVADL